MTSTSRRPSLIASRQSSPRIRLGPDVGGVALGEDQINHREHAVQPLADHVERRHLIRDTGIADLGFRAHQPLRHGLFRDQKGLGDLRGRQSTDRAQRQSNLSLFRQGRMAAGEDQPQDVVLQRALRRLLLRNPFANPKLGHLLGFDLFALGEKAHMTPQPVDRLMAADIDEPGARIGRDAFARPLHDGGCEGILHGVLGELEVAKEADQRGQNAAALVAEQKSDLIRHLRYALSRSVRSNYRP